jgi:hypothetical protein
VLLDGTASCESLRSTGWVVLLGVRLPPGRTGSRRTRPTSTCEAICLARVTAEGVKRSGQSSRSE